MTVTVVVGEASWTPRHLYIVFAHARRGRREQRLSCPCRLNLPAHEYGRGKDGSAIPDAGCWAASRWLRRDDKLQSDQMPLSGLDEA